MGTQIVQMVEAMAKNSAEEVPLGVIAQEMWVIIMELDKDGRRPMQNEAKNKRQRERGKKKKVKAKVPKPGVPNYFRVATSRYPRQTGKSADAARHEALGTHGGPFFLILVYHSGYPHYTVGRGCEKSVSV